MNNDKWIADAEAALPTGLRAEYDALAAGISCLSLRGPRMGEILAPYATPAGPWLGLRGGLPHQGDPVRGHPLDGVACYVAQEQVRRGTAQPFSVWGSGGNYVVWDLPDGRAVVDATPAGEGGHGLWYVPDGEYRYDWQRGDATRRALTDGTAERYA